MKIEEAVAVLKASPDHRVIERLPILTHYFPEDQSEKKLAIYLDTETTGFRAGEDHVIELAMILFEYNAQGYIYRIVDVFDEYQDPGIPIPEQITKITGITDEMVKGKSIDLEKVKELLDQAALVIAHNAQFDRAFAEELTPLFKQKCWACSLEDVPWADEGLESSKLEYLAYRFGFFYEGHRAKTDCYAGIHLLSQDLPTNGKKVLAQLLENAKAPRYEVRAIQSPFETKDVLKTRGYRWKQIAKNQKCWVTMVVGDAIEQEKAFLESEIYSGHQSTYEIKKISPFERFSLRDS